MVKGIKVVLMFIGGLTVWNQSTKSDGGSFVPFQDPNRWAKKANTSNLALAGHYAQAIMAADPTNHLGCPEPDIDRYGYLRKDIVVNPSHQRDFTVTRRKHFFALDLTQCVDRIRPLMSAIIQSMRLLGPENCALSIVEGRSTDGTFEVLQTLREKVEAIGASFYLATNEANPTKADDDDKKARVVILAELRNQALAPLLDSPAQYAPDTTILFLNDVAPCAEDILELLHQHIQQKADMTCAMDWTYVGPHPSFYDVWVSRGMTGDTFFDLPPSGSYDNHWNLFWNDRQAQNQFYDHKPFQVFSCWNGVVALSAEPFINGGLRFRGSKPEECIQGEPQILAKDLWKMGHGKIAVVPSVNLAYDMESAQKVKEAKGYVSDWVRDGDSQHIEWETKPPAKVKCMPTPKDQHWLPWDESLDSSDESRIDLR